MSQPTCPDCKQQLTFIDSFKNINPWRYKCPHCKSAIQISANWKQLTILSMIIGVFFGLFAAYQQEIGLWQRTDSLLFCALFIIVICLISLACWHKVTFQK